MKDNYHLLYRIDAHPEGLRRDQVPDQHGACDSMVFGSIIHQEDGSISHLLASVDGRTGEPLPPHQVFMFWAVMAGALADQLEAGGRQMLCRGVFELIRRVVQERPDATPGHVLGAILEEMAYDGTTAEQCRAYLAAARWLKADEEVAPAKPGETVH